MKIRLLLFLFVLANSVLFSCKQKNHWELADTNENLKLNNQIKSLSSQKEIPNDDIFEEELDTTLTKSSGVEYVVDQSSKIDLRCRTVILNDTLFINLGISNGFSSEGFVILFHNKSFIVKETGQTDVVIENAPEPKQKILYQKLILDKENYSLGDSIYGYVDFKIEKTFLNTKTNYSGKGYFRTKINEN